MQIFVLTEIDFSSNAGNIAHFVEVMQALARKGYKLKIFTPKGGNHIKKNFDLNFIDVPILRFKFFGLLSYQLSLSIYFLFHLFRGKPALIYSRIDFYLFLGSVAGKLFKIPNVLEVNGLKRDELKLSNKPKGLIYLVNAAYKIAIEMSDLILTITPGKKQQILECYNCEDEKVCVIHNGVNTELFKPLEKEDKRNNYSKTYHTLKVGFIGNFSPIQGIEYFIKAIPFVLEKHSNIEFLIAGDGDIKYKKNLLSLIKNLNIENKIQLLGEIQYKQSPDIINSFDICVAPYIIKRNDAIGISPIKTLCYFSCGKPVITSRIKGLEYIEEEHIGLLVEPENPKELANAIIKLSIDSHLRVAMGQKGRQLMESQYSWEKIADRIDKELFHNLF